MTTNAPVSTIRQPARRGAKLAMLLAVAAALIGLVGFPALTASASPAPASAAAAARGVTSSVLGAYTLHYSWGCTASYGQASITFNSNGTFTSPPYTGEWLQQDGTLLWEFAQAPNSVYGGTIDGHVGSGAMSTFKGSSGCWYLTAAGTTGGAGNVTRRGQAPDQADNNR